MDTAGMNEPLSLLDRLLPSQSGMMTFLSSSPFVAVGLVVLLLVLIRRHGLLYYGSKLTSYAGIPLFGMLSVPLLLSGSQGMGSIFFLLIIGIFATELFLNSYTYNKRHFAVFDIGFLLVLLSLGHLGILVLIPFYIINLKKMDLMDWRHFGAILLGGFTVWWFDFVLTVVPTIDGVKAWWFGNIEQLRAITLPTPGSELIFYGAYLVALFAVSLFYYNFHTRALERHRFFARIHLILCWLTFGLQLLYSFGNVVELYMVLSLFFLCVMLQVFYASIRDKIWLGLMAMIVFGVLGTMLYTLFGQ
ncbi:hypothetical protein HQ35_08040 [Porphyromonas cangingivalis]|uniref:Uncharacterized protein n=1 Tax=Porphyromonas cangingivalis TaxID=36874 RepID=A0A0A2ESA0_PORCN|nr:hypothetical protein [Porphyromonas cangingivalis]KGN79244.1 hypothetical protein HQ35_08040 [Porphyromonas cangingivalis]